MDIKTAILLTLVAVGEIFLIRFEIRLGTFQISDKYLILGLLGTVPSFFLTKQNRIKYFAFSILLAGIGGILFVGASFLKCEGNDVFCDLHDSPVKLFTSIALYSVMSVLGVAYYKRIKASDDRGSKVI